MKKKPIGIFDSGVGGLTVLESLIKEFPNESFIYFADTARAPYGSKTNQELFQINKEVIDFLISKKIKTLISACNTSSATVFKSITKNINIPTAELIQPASIEAIEQSNKKRIAVLATQATINNKGYSRIIKSLDSDCEVIEIACPELVPIAERNDIYSKESIDACKKYMDIINESDIDVLIHGCSHYPFFEKIFEAHLNSKVLFINPAETITKALKPILMDQSAHEINVNSRVEYWVSGSLKKFHHFLINRTNLEKEPLLNQYNVSPVFVK